MKKNTLQLFLMIVIAFAFQSNAQSVVIGTGTDLTTSTGSDPIDGYYNSFRYQVVYTLAELSTALTPYDEITGLGWSVAGDYGGGALLGYTIKIGHTSATNSSAHDASATTVVKNAFDYDPTVTSAGAFDMIPFDTNFVWNGVENILVEICSDGQNPFTSPYGQVRTTAVATGSRFYRVDNNTACGENTSSTNGNKPNVQFDYIDGTPPTDELDFYNLQFPATGSISIGDSFEVYAQCYEAGLTDTTTGQAPGINAWIGYSTSDTDPSGSGWTWIAASFNTEVGNNDEYFLDLGTSIPALGTYYYASRWSLNGAPFTYGGIQADASFGGVWGDNNNISGILTVNPSANDECSGAIALTVNTDFSCAVVTSSTTLGATASPQPDDATGTPNNDVWFSFVAVGASHQIVISNVVNLGGGTSTSTDMGMSVFNDLAGCSMVAANEVGESDPNTLFLSGLTPSSTYYVRVYGWYSSIQNNNFDICVGTPPPPPANNDCSNAIALTPGTLFESNALSGQTQSGATASGELPLPSCSSYDPDDVTGFGGDVWYSVVVPADGNLEIETQADPTGSGGDSGMSVYSGTCGSLTEVDCDDDDSSDGFYSLVSISDPTLANQTLYIRIFEYGGDDSLDFQVSAYSSTLSINEFENTNAFTYFPNPVKDIFTLRAQSNIQNISIYNMLGQEVLRTEPNTLQSDINMNELQSGAYFVKVSINNSTETIRVIKQ